MCTLLARRLRPGSSDRAERIDYLLRLGGGGKLSLSASGFAQQNSSQAISLRYTRRAFDQNLGDRRRVHFGMVAHIHHEAVNPWARTPAMNGSRLVRQA